MGSSEEEQSGDRLREDGARLQPSPPAALAEIDEPERFFAEAGEQIQTAVTATRDQILGERRPGESVEDFRRRSYQALHTAEELVLSDHFLFQPEETGEHPPEDDQTLAADHRMQALVNEALMEPLDQ